MDGRKERGIPDGSAVRVRDGEKFVLIQKKKSPGVPAGGFLLARKVNRDSAAVLPNSVRNAYAFWSSERTCCGWALAWANTVLAACDRIWSRVRFEVSEAKFVSMIADSALDTFS